MNFSKARKMIFRLVFLIAIGFLLYVIISQYVKIQRKNDELRRMNEEIAAIKDENEKIKREIEENENSNSKDSETTIFENVTE